MAAPNYSPASGVGTTSTDSQGNTYRYNGTTWTQISSGGGNNSSNSSSSKQIGGWYNNNGQNMRYWGDAGWTTGSDPTGGGGSSSPSTGDDYLQNSVNSIAGMVNSIPAYEKDNPFAFDAALARTATTAEYSPYYKETLSDYTSSVERKLSRSTNDLETTLEQLLAGKEYYTGTQRRALEKAERSTNEGYAGKGLFFSGVRKRDIAELKEEEQAQTGNYLKNYEYNVNQAKLTDTRGKEDINTASSQYTRDLDREKKFAIESGVLTKRGEYMDEYNIKKNAYYASKGLNV
ncbi:hypothetical protein M0R04_10250 [Candidatus Dojkabacteria bacterium]|jgi:hypothetical protein|nr:hypothetical protein [Candidatus Dojkabacteria bacterium]